jgi:hypothetical protein
VTQRTLHDVTFDVQSPSMFVCRDRPDFSIRYSGRRYWRIYDGERLYDDMRFATRNDAIAALSQRDSRFPDR